MSVSIVHKNALRCVKALRESKKEIMSLKALTVVYDISQVELLLDIAQWLKDNTAPWSTEHMVKGNGWSVWYRCFNGKKFSDYCKEKHGLAYIQLEIFETIVTSFSRLPKKTGIAAGL